MIKKILALLFIVSIAVFLIGCKAEIEEPETAPIEPIEPVTETETTTDADIADVESDIAEIDTLEDDLGLDELESLEQELDDLNW